MRNAHIAFVSFPHPPHVNPTLPIVSVLARRGHRVTYVTSDRFTGRVVEAGGEPIQCPVFDVNVCFDHKDNDRGDLHVLQPLIDGTLAEISPFYEVDRPDLIIYDSLGLAGQVLARRWNIPAIRTSPTFAVHADYVFQQFWHPEHRAVAIEAAKKTDRLLAEYGITDSDFLFHKEHLNIFLFPRVLQPCANAFGSDYLFAGRCAGEQPHYGNWRKQNAGGRPVILVSTSTTYVRGPDYFNLCIEAFRDLGWHVLLSIGDSGDRKALGSLPPHFEIVQHTAHVKVLPFVTAFVCLGGIITQAEAAYHGVPLLVLSLGFPELEWQARFIEELGLGMHLKKADTNAGTLKSYALQVVSNEKIRRSVMETQRIVRHDAGGEEVANRIEEYLGAL